MKILIAGHDLKFIKFYIDHLKGTEHQVEIDEWENHVAHNIQKSFELLRWADVIFCEWGLGNAVFYSNNKRDHQRLIVRLHRQELETNYLNQANYEKIDAFITVSPYIYEEFSRTFNLPRSKMHLVYNNVDLEKFKNYGSDKNRKFNLGMVGYLPKLKRMDLALDIFEKLYHEDKRYKLYFKGKKPEGLRWLWRIDEEREYYEEQFQRIEEAEWKENVIFEPFGDVVDFYNNMEFILSVSDIESFHLAAAEGMACGAVPVINNWEGSDTIYPSTFLLNDIGMINDFIFSIRENKYLNYLMEEEVSKYSTKIIVQDINNMIAKLLDK